MGDLVNYTPDTFDADKSVVISGYGTRNDELFETIEDYVETLFPMEQIDVQELLEAVKVYPVFEKDPLNIPTRVLENFITDYLEDNYGSCYWDVEPSGMELVAKFCEEFNSKQTWYTNGKIVGTLDMSKDIKQFLEDNNMILEKSCQN